MRFRRGTRGRGRILAWVAGYTGTTVLVAAAIVVLLLPLIDDGKGSGTAGAQGSPSPSGTAPGGPPGDPALPGAPTGPAQQPDGGGPAGGDPSGVQGPAGQGGGPPIPTRGAGGDGDWCPEGTAVYRAADRGVDVVIVAASSGAIRAELILRGREPQSQQTTVPGGRPHTFHFAGVSPQMIERVKVTTVTVGVSMQTCYARAA
ncbi:MAG: hypothetical protein FWJ90_08430 [Actinomadura sp.]